jgi:hypothetical protein
MAARHYTMTLSAVAQPLSVVLAVAQRGGTQDEAYRSLQVQADKANTNDAFLGGPTVTTADYGIRVDPADTAGPITVCDGFSEGPIKLSDIYAVGTAAEKLHIFGIPF